MQRDKFLINEDDVSWYEPGEKVPPGVTLDFPPLLIRGFDDDETEEREADDNDEDNGESRHGTKGIPGYSKYHPGKGGAGGGGDETETRSLASRRRLRDLYRPLIVAAVEPSVAHEVALIREHVPRLLRQRSQVDVLNWLEQTQREALSPELVRAMQPLIAAYGSSVDSAILAELKLTVFPELADAFVLQYSENMAQTYLGRSFAQVRQVLEKADAAHKDAMAALEERLSEWLATRAGKVADIEAVRAGEASARNAYRRGGVRQLRWHTVGKSCPFCTHLNGKVVSIQEDFLPAGVDYQPEGATAPLRPRSRIGHAPLHRGCDCVLSPA